MVGTHKGCNPPGQPHEMPHIQGISLGKQDWLPVGQRAHHVTSIYYKPEIVKRIPVRFQRRFTQMNDNTDRV